MKEIITKNIKILVVEDNPISSFIAMSQLKRFGFEKVDVVENGLLALKYLDQSSPDLIFLDLNMPELDGFEFLKITRRNGICPNIAIVILTSSISQCDKKRVIEYSNVIDFLEKPLDRELINQVIQKLYIRSYQS
ncbi:response regulator [Arenibacter sp. 6A1]|uniref:response regulator n=1 Tax=Arenibacter sp. 6A1 TaxID=2720391 RepID=UPI0014477DDB|nr:response regulator [Arenibacter sp. 6A1]NKI28434.1 response regulator [Arenibacter sp. 6A1]